MKKTLAMMMSLLCLCACLTGCGSGEEVSMVEDSEGNLVPATKPQIVAEEVELIQGTTESEKIQATTTEVAATTESISEDAESAENEEYEYTLTPLTEANVGEEYAFHLVRINGVEIDLTDIHLAELLTQTNTVANPFGSCYLEMDNYLFSGGHLGVEAKLDENMAGMTITIDGVEYSAADFPTLGTSIAYEVVDEKGELVFDDELNLEEAENYRVVGINHSCFWVDEEYPMEVTFFGGITVGISEQELINLFGEGTLYEETFADERYYYNGNSTMIATVEEETDEAGNSVRIVDEITIIMD